jgi:hypothetical protein
MKMLTGIVAIGLMMMPFAASLAEENTETQATCAAEDLSEGAYFLEMQGIKDIDFERLPVDVRCFLANAGTCEHFGGEPGYDAARQQEINEALEKYCRNAVRQIAPLKAKYAHGTQQVKKALSVCGENSMAVCATFCPKGHEVVLPDGLWTCLPLINEEQVERSNSFIPFAGVLVSKRPADLRVDTGKKLDEHCVELKIFYDGSYDTSSRGMRCLYKGMDIIEAYAQWRLETARRYENPQDNPYRKMLEYGKNLHDKFYYLDLYKKGVLDSAEPPAPDAVYREIFYMWEANRLQIKLEGELGGEEIIFTQEADGTWMESWADLG